MLSKKLLELRLYSNEKSISGQLLVEEVYRPFRSLTIPEE